MFHPFEQHLIDRLGTVCQPRERLLVGVSGGADSVALLRGVTTIAEQCSFNVIAVHYNHGVRGDAEADQRWVAELCERLSVPLVTNWNGPNVPGNVSRGEAELREARYEFVQRVARKERCRVLCMAHHADDQIETALHHLIRGTSLRGLAGIRPVRTMPDDLILCRPLLETSRAEILSYLAEREQDFREDPTNQDQSFTRNRIRHELIPLLVEMNPQFGMRLLDLVAQAAETTDFHENLVRQTLGDVVISRDSQQVRLQVARLLTLPAFLRRDLLVEVWTQQNWPRQKMGSREWRKLAELLEETSGRLNLPGRMTAERTGAMLRLTRSQ
ncbi:tRNA lysidine(34) synthetase TilS [Rubinisphaera margarita]|uniref:tRNA lysidine(34) synthetase TilS n=1 Tax=Rubinisphaera margarita TaxID=2909586 RepID=UPI001EE8F4EE|nr:tRNA lysidine(34) synthetase TilS [Rubinisphaera margarita]MCG6154717.1 tRNA lysidine(34) synthetase TilS [Rubinisphaera margarita]